jgi:hypothetical protein
VARAETRAETHVAAALAVLAAIAATDAICGPPTDYTKP